MSLDTLNNGDSGLEARTKINAAIAAVNAGTLVRGIGVLQGNTTPGIDPNPPTSVIDAFSWGVGDASIITLSTNDSLTRTIKVSVSDPADGSDWLDTSSIANATDLTAALGTIISSYPEYTSVSAAGAILYFSGTLPGSVYAITATATGTLSASVLSPGGDGQPATGGILSVIVIPKISGKKTLPLRIGLFGSTGDCTLSFSLSSTSISLDLCNPVTVNVDSGEVELGMTAAPITPFITAWLNGLIDADLTANIQGYIADGATINVWAICEQA